jgi:hypothetical protein
MFALEESALEGQRSVFWQSRRMWLLFAAPESVKAGEDMVLSSVHCFVAELFGQCALLVRYCSAPAYSKKVPKNHVPPGQRCDNPAKRTAYFVKCRSGA